MGRTSPNRDNCSNCKVYTSRIPALLALTQSSARSCSTVAFVLVNVIDIPLPRFTHLSMSRFDAFPLNSHEIAIKPRRELSRKFGGFLAEAFERLDVLAPETALFWARPFFCW